MNQTLPIPTRPSRRLGIAEAKAHFSEMLRNTDDGPTVIHSRGRDVAVVIPMAQFESLSLHSTAPRTGGARFLARVEELKKRLGGGVEDFEPARLDFKSQDPFGSRRKKRK